MSQQQTLAMAAGFEKHAKVTRRAELLRQIEIVVPWRELVGEIEPFYPKVGNGRPPVGVERMLRMYFLQQWFNLADPAVEDALYDSVAMRHFVGIDLGREPVPDETTVCKFRHLLERHGLGVKILARVNGYRSGDLHKNGYGFPSRFRIEIADELLFTNPRVLVNAMDLDFPDPGAEIQELAVPSVTG